MIKNVKLKKILVNRVFPFFTFINKKIKKDEYTIFIHSANGDLNDNSAAIYNYLISKGYNEKYKIVCSVSNPAEYANNTQNVLFIKNNYKIIIQFMRSKFVLYSMGKIPIIPTDDQMVINLWHGIPLKTIALLSNINNGREFYFSYVCSSSEFYKPIMARAFGCPEKNVLVCGEPKTDNLLLENEDTQRRLVVWAPTFRKSKFLGYDDTSSNDILPIFKNNELFEMNRMLAKYGVEMIVKLHPLQDLGDFVSCELDNLKVYSHKDFIDKGLELYSLLGRSSALITDYSSVGLEYMILDRPIAYSIDDIEEYKNNRGFVVDNPFDLMPGKLIENKIDFESFICDVANNRDEYKELRNETNKLCNKYNDGKNSQRILDFAGIRL